MLLIEPAAVGPGAYARMVRDGLVTPLSARWGHAADVPPSAPLRSAVLAHAVTTHGALSGLAALWVYGWRGDFAPPRETEVAVARGSHPDPPVTVPPGTWRFVTETRARGSARLVGSVRVVAPPHAVAAALMRSPLGTAIPAAMWALTHRMVTEEAVRAALASGRRGAAARRGLAAWEAIGRALRGR